MAADLRTGVIGYGIAGRVFHAPLISSTPGLELTAIVTTDTDRRARASAAYPDAELLDTADDLYASGIDLVVVGTPNKTHVDLALAAIDQGIAVVVDKPFAPTAAEARRGVDAAKAKGVPLTVFQNRRWDSDFRTVREVVASGKLGNLSRFESRYERWVPEI